MQFQSEKGFDLLLDFRAELKFVMSVFQSKHGHEEAVYARADHWAPQAGRGGVAIKDLSRGLGFSDAAFYTWRRKFGGLEVADAKRQKDIQAENTRLKKLLAESLWTTQRSSLLWAESLDPAGQAQAAADTADMGRCSGRRTGAGGKPIGARRPC